MNHVQGGWPPGETHCWPDSSRPTTRRCGSSATTRCTGWWGCRARRAPVGLTLALGRLRALGAVGLRVALPVPGHPLGLSGPPEFNARALEAEEAVRRARAPRWGWCRRCTRPGPAGDVHVGGGLALPAGAGGAARRRALAGRGGAGAGGGDAGGDRGADAAGRGGLGAGGGGGAGGVPGADGGGAARLLAPGYPPRAVRVLELAQRVGRWWIAYGGRDDGRARRGGERRRRWRRGRRRCGRWSGRRGGRRWRRTTRTRRSWSGGRRLGGARPGRATAAARYARGPTAAADGRQGRGASWLTPVRIGRVAAVGLVSRSGRCCRRPG